MKAKDVIDEVLGLCLIPVIYTAWFVIGHAYEFHQYIHRNDPPPPPDPRWPTQPTFHHKSQTHFTVEDP